jgi:hypothetical protein
MMPRMKASSAMSWMGVALAFGLALSAQATLFIPLSLGDLTKKADLVVHGLVLAKHSEADSQGRIFTKVDLQVIEVWKGEVKSSPLTVVHGGGELNGRRSMVTGQVDYQPGQETVAFLVRNGRGEAVTLGLAQGQFQVWKDAVTGEKLARNIFLGGGSSNTNAIQRLDGGAGTRLTLDGLKRQVKESAQ